MSGSAALGVIRAGNFTASVGALSHSTLPSCKSPALGYQTWDAQKDKGRCSGQEASRCQRPCKEFSGL